MKFKIIGSIVIVVVLVVLYALFSGGQTEEQADGQEQTVETQ